MIHAIRLAWMHLRATALVEFQYRANFFTEILSGVIRLVTGLFAIDLIFRQTPVLGGWQQAELLAMMGVYTILGSVLWGVVEPAVSQLMTDIQQGTLDFAILRPADAQLLVSVRRYNVWSIVDLVMGIGVLGVALVQLGRPITLVQVLAFLLTLGMGALMIYSFWLIVACIAFRAIRLDNLFTIFEGLFGAARFPVGIYPGWLRLVLTFVIPVAFAVTVPSEAIVGRLTPETFAVATAVSLVIFALARLVWRLSIRGYSGASA